MSDKKREKHHHHKSRKTVGTIYASRVITYVALAVIVTVLAVYIAMPKASEFVHLVEKQFPMTISDITTDDELVEIRKAGYGANIGDIKCESFGLNCKLYYGANRVSMRNGAGVSGKKDLFDGCTYITGYSQTCLSSLHFAEVGDIITVTTSDFDVDYRVESASYVEKGKAEYNGASQNVLIICAKESDFSKHSGQDFCVIATAIGEVS